MKRYSTKNVGELSRSNRSLSIPLVGGSVHPLREACVLTESRESSRLLLLLPVLLLLPTSFVSGAKVEASTDTKLTPLMVAAQEGRVSSVELLLRAGARVKVTPPPHPALIRCRRFVKNIVNSGSFSVSTNYHAGRKCTDRSCTNINT